MSHCQVPVVKHGNKYLCHNRAAWALANDVGAFYSCGSHLARACGLLLDNYGTPDQHIQIDRIEDR